MEQPPTPQQEIPPEIARLLKLFADKLIHENTASIYANNTRFEASVWDLKLLFGQLQQDGNAEVDWRTSVTIPWAQAKIFTYYLRLNLAFHESNHGPIKVASGVMPQLTPPSEELLKSDPKARELFETYKKIHSETFGPEGR